MKFKEIFLISLGQLPLKQGVFLYPKFHSDVELHSRFPGVVLKDFVEGFFRFLKLSSSIAELWYSCYETYPPTPTRRNHFLSSPRGQEFPIIK